MGELALDKEQELIGAAKSWLEQKAATSAGFRLYLDRWGDWPNPWKAD
jgi:hypothetical protein